ncbi:hypothetical protein B0H66DRAFT_594400 [Apodospora peruviana]|uniref:HMG box domain-containing protein n=1 Tax=Apodospora peruviana TaxID=516989 RepID=A0AAE0HV70_9PEZI|nr:hypothetical protein B0H66DRAFT_594400 [Apodospora peruviana]
MAPATSIPPALPPSVEEAYRRKCIKLKQRTIEVEEANDAARMRLSRLKRQVEKMRLERAFLLEQLSKRTSTNVEDSDGSPSPPPTPKEKPLRIKRGHRKPSMLANLESTPSAAGGSGGGPSFINQNPNRTHSPSSEFSTQQHQTNGTHSKAPKKPGSAFDLYCDETRASLLHEKQKNKAEDHDDDAENGDDKADDDGDINMDEELARGWKDLDDSQRDEFHAREQQAMAKYQEKKEAYNAKQKEKEEAAAAAAADEAADAAAAAGSQSDGGGDRRQRSRPRTEDATEEPETQRGADGDEDDRTPHPGQEDEDVEMGENYDTDPDDTQVDKAE